MGLFLVDMPLNSTLKDGRPGKKGDGQAWSAINRGISVAVGAIAELSVPPMSPPIPARFDLPRCERYSSVCWCVCTVLGPKEHVPRRPHATWHGCRLDATRCNVRFCRAFSGYFFFGLGC